MEVQEDRVFGRPELFPPPPLRPVPATSYDLCSVTVEGSQVVYARKGTSANPPLVFVHGWAASHKFWRHCLEAFSLRYHCIAPDLVGYGLSEKPRRDYSLEAYATWLGKFLDAVELPRAPIVAHSMGATIALLFALDHPERVERLAVVNPLVQGSTAFTRRTRLLMLPVVRWIALGLSRIRWFRRWIAKDFSYVARLDDELADDVARGTYASLLQPLLSMKKLDLVPRLGGLKGPTLAVGTDRDLIVAPWQYERIPAARKVRIPDTGHIPMIERPEEFVLTLDAFLRSPKP